MFTGQHPAISAEQFGLAEYPCAQLDCAGKANPHAHVRTVARALQPLLGGSAGLTVVQGDTSSALGGALASRRAAVPVAHVEAGLRTGDPRRPWPEEAYRVRIDRHADLLFAATALSAENLRREEAPGDIHVTGNTAIDALLAIAGALPVPSLREGGAPTILVTCHRRESWGEGLKGIARALRRLTAAGEVRVKFVLHPNPHVAAIMREQLEGGSGISLVHPCSHSELVASMCAADLILTDSGGMQEEAPALGVPLLILRDKTERPEGLASGNMRLVGTSEDRIVDEVRALLGNPQAYAAMSRKAYPYGDGRAAPRIAAVIEDWLSARR